MVTSSSSYVCSVMQGSDCAQLLFGLAPLIPKGTGVALLDQRPLTMLPFAYRVFVLALVGRVGAELAGPEPIFAYLRGKHGSKYMTHLASAWCMS